MPTTDNVPTLPDTTDPRVGTTFRHADGWIITVSTEYDHDASVADAECWTDAQRAAHAAGEWWFALLCVTVEREGVELGRAYLGGIEEGWFTYTDEDDNVAGRGYVGAYSEAVEDLVEEAISEARGTLAALAADFAELEEES